VKVSDEGAQLTDMHTARCVLLEPIDRYLSGQISGARLVRFVDDLIGDDRVGEYPQSLRELVDRFQEELSLYINDHPSRTDLAEGYYGGVELRRRVEAFRSLMAAAK
jgi:hypothetical protein